MTLRIWLLNPAITVGANVTAASLTATDGTAATLVSPGTGGSITLSSAHPWQGRNTVLVSTPSGASASIRLPFAAANLSGAENFMHYIEALPPVTVAAIAAPRHSAGQLGRVGMTAAGKITINDASGAVLATSAASYTPGQWNRIEITNTTATSTTGSATVRVYNGTSTTADVTVTASGVNLGTASLATMDLGTPSNYTGGTTFNQWFAVAGLNDGSTTENGPYVPVNAKPTVTGSPAIQNVAAGAPVSATFTASDTDGTVVSRATDFAYPASGPAISNGGTATPGFTAGTAGNLYQLRQTVTDDGGATSDPAVVEVRVPTSGALRTLNGNGSGSTGWTKNGALATMGAVLANTDNTQWVELTTTAVEQERRFRISPSVTRSSLTFTVTLGLDPSTPGSDTFKLRLYQGSSTTPLQEWSRTVTSTTPVDEVCNVTGATLAAITDSGNLELGIVGID